MSEKVTLDNLVVFQRGELNMETVINERPATVSDLVEALKAEGVGEVLPDATIRDKRGNYRNGDFLVVRLEDT